MSSLLAVGDCDDEQNTFYTFYDSNVGFVFSDCRKCIILSQNILPRAEATLQDANKGRTCTQLSSKIWR